MSRYSNVVIFSTGLVSVDRAPAAPAFLAGVCEKLNVNYEIFDFNIHIKKSFGTSMWERLFTVPIEDDYFSAIDDDVLQQLKKIIASGVDKILELKPDLFVVTVLSFVQFPYTKLILEELRGRSNIPVIAGGTGISYQTSCGSTVGKRLLDNNLLDYYVLGEGDSIFEQFLKGKEGLGLNHKNNKWESWVPQIDELDGLTLPSYKKYKFSDYITVNWGNGESATLSITGSRGCVRRCTFCDIGHVWKKFRFRTADDIIKEIIKHYDETGVLNYHFSDSLINGSLKQFTALLEKLVAMQEQRPELKNLRFQGQYIIREKKHHPERIYELMGRAGLYRLEVGVESGSEQVRAHMGKKFSNEDIDYHYEMCSKYRITNSLLMFTGYPTETLEDHNDTLNMLRRYQKYLIDRTITILVLSDPMLILRNTPIDSMKDELGLELFNGEYGNTLWTSSSNPTFTVIERYRRFLETNTLSIELGYPRSHDVLQRTVDHVREVVRLKGNTGRVKEKYDELISSLLTNEENEK